MRHTRLRGGARPAPRITCPYGLGDDPALSTPTEVAWRQFCFSDDGLEVARAMEGVGRSVVMALAETADPQRSPRFGLLPGETRRVVIDGVPFDVTRDRDPETDHEELD